MSEIDIEKTATDSARSVADGVSKVRLFFRPPPGVPGTHSQKHRANDIVAVIRWKGGQETKGLVGSIGVVPIMDLSIHILAASLKGIRKLAALGPSGEPTREGPPPPPLDSVIEDRMDWWRTWGECGNSSMTIFYTLSDKPWLQGDRKAAPLDEDDVRRCQLLLDLIPEWRQRMGEVAASCRGWGVWAHVWPEVESLGEKAGKGWARKRR